MALFDIPINNQNLLVHTDVLNAIRFPITTRSEFFLLHENYLKKTFIHDNIYFPAFNYDCLKTGIYNVIDDPVQVGVLNEFLRKREMYFRSHVPVFSFISNKEFQYSSEEVDLDPFGKDSTFSLLNNSQSFLIHYGSLFSSSTIIHYVERLFSKLFYRYDKIFHINIVGLNESHTVNLKYHVRPLGFNLEYDWVLIEEDLIESKILSNYKNGRTKLYGASINELVNFWLNKLEKDPFYFLQPSTKINVKNRLDSLGRRFLITDFE